MYRNRDNSFCCGAGGGIKSSFPDVALETAKTRVREAEGVEGVQKIVTPCPFCVTNLGDGAKALGSKMEVVDLIQLVDQALRK
jgi:Fe-S oxidoreductase